MQVFDPTGLPVAVADSDPDWRLSLEGRQVGILWNGKPNADVMLRVMERQLKETYGVAGTVWVNKSEVADGPGRPAPQVILDRLAAGTVAVLTGSGD